MLQKSRKYFFSLTLFLFSLFFLTGAFSQISHADVSPDERAQLEAQLKELEAESAKIQADLNNKIGERKGLESDLKIINDKIAQSKNQIAKTTTQIKKIAVDINVKQNKIKDLASNISQNVKYIKTSLQEMRKLDDVRAVIAYSSDQNLAELFVDNGDYRAIQGKLAQNMDQLKTNKKFVEIEKDQLIDKKDETEALKEKQLQDQNQELARSKEKKTLISITKQQEKDYQTVLAQQQAKVAEIKAKLFSFAGGQTAAIPFATALANAQVAESSTGVPAAFTLAILMQESALGANVGKCYLTDSSTGAGINTRTNAPMSNVMKPSRDVPLFISITAALGLDWHKTIVSCPIAGVGGYGGAMGPAQFIPSTWNIVAPKVAAITGSSNPWNAKDAIVGSATYLASLGANTSYLSQIKAACKYYGTGGSNCSYGRQVMSKLNGIQGDIDYLKQYGTTKN